jgi:chromosome segregation ATPase
MKLHQINKVEKTQEQLEKFVKEIETLKTDKTQYDQERNSLMNRLNNEIKKQREFAKKVHELEKAKLEEKDHSDISDDSDIGIDPKMKKSLFSTNPDQTFNIKELEEQEENKTKDEQILDLQNQIILFNQKHVNDMKDLEYEKNKEVERILKEKEENDEINSNKIDEITKEKNLIHNTNTTLTERISELERLVSDIELDLCNNPPSSTSQNITISKRGKRSKKGHSGLNNSVDNSIDSVTYNPVENHGKLMSCEFILYPTQLISLIIESK